MLWVFGGFALEPPTRGSAPGPRWGTSVPQIPCAPLPPNPGYATVEQAHKIGINTPVITFNLPLWLKAIEVMPSITYENALFAYVL